MPLTEEIGDGNEKLPEEQERDMFFAMLEGRTWEDFIETSRGKFKVKYPKQKDLITIGRIAAFMRGGIPAAQFDESTEYEIQKCAALDVIVSGGPAWYEKAKKRDKNFSWRNVPDAHFVDEVYAKAQQFRQKVQEQLAGHKMPVAEEAAGEVSGGISSDVDNGLFEGVSSSAQRDQP